MEHQLNPDPLVDVSGAAVFMNTSDRHVRLLISKQAITVTRIGNKVRFKLSDLNNYLDSQTTPAKAVQ